MSATKHDPETLRSAIAKIEEHGSHNTAALEALLKQSCGLKLRRRFTTDAKGQITMLGIPAEGPTMGETLRLWAQAARRALLGAR